MAAPNEAKEIPRMVQLCEALRKPQPDFDAVSEAAKLVTRFRAVLRGERRKNSSGC